MPNSMTVDGARLRFDALGLGALANMPVGGRLEDTQSAAAIEVTGGIGILTLSVAILSPSLESKGLSKQKAVPGTSMSVGETGGWFHTCLEMAKQFATNSTSRLRE